MSRTIRLEFTMGAIDTIPLIVGAIPFGIIYGTLSHNSDLSIYGALALSSIVFAGSSQFVALGLIASGSSIFIIIATTFLINLRHLLYSFSLRHHLSHLPQKWKIPLSFGLTDETFAVTIKHYSYSKNNESKHWYFLGSFISMYVNWQICTIIGIIFGSSFPEIKNWGLEFAMSATFIGIVIPYLKSKPMIVTAIASSTLVLILKDLPNNLGLIISSIISISIGVLLELKLLNNNKLK